MRDEDGTVFEGTDYSAAIKLSDNTLTLVLTFSDTIDAQELLRELLEAHKAGEDVTITLSQPVLPS